MLKRITCIIAVLLLILPLTFVSVNSYAYVSASEFKTSSGEISLNCSYDGIVIIQRLFRSSKSPEVINSPLMLDNSYFSSGTWNGSAIPEGYDRYLNTIDVTGFSQAVSYSPEKDYFVYLLTTCLPVKAGDNFKITSSYNGAMVTSSSYYSFYSYIPGGSGLQMVHAEMGNEHPEKLTYTVNSKNQHLFAFISPDLSVNSSSYSYPSFVSSSNSIFTYNFSSSCDIFTSSYNYIGELSFTLKEDVKNYSFSVYEILTDGTMTPGYNTEGSGDSGGGTGGDSGGGDGEDETSKNIFESVKGIAGKIGDILTSIKNLPTNIATSIQGFFNDIKVSITTTIDGLKEHLVYLFVPSDNNNFNKCKELINEKFQFIDQITETFSNFVDMVSNPPEAAAIDEDGGHGGGGSYRDFNGPKTAIDFDVYGKQFEVNFMNWDLYDKYKPVIDNIIVFCAWFFFLQRLIRRIPRIIGGFT